MPSQILEIRPKTRAATLGLGAVTRLRPAAEPPRDVEEPRAGAFEARLDERDEPCARDD